MFQSRDWVDRFSGVGAGIIKVDRLQFQSRDWVDRFSGIHNTSMTPALRLFQSRDWVDRFSGYGFHLDGTLDEVVSIPRLG